MFKDLFTRKPAVNSHTLVSVPKEGLPPDGWKRNKWVMVNNDKIGIVTEFYPTCEVHLVADDGTTYLVIKTDLHTLRIARANEIPACRRPTPEVAQELGYGA